MNAPANHNLSPLHDYKLLATGLRLLFCLLSAAYCLLFSSCQKTITVEIPPAKEKIVVDGRIEAGISPYVILTHNMPYFGNTDLTSIEKLFIHNAVIKVSDGTNTATLTEYCSKSIPDSLLPIVAAFTGVDSTFLRNFNYCIYTTFDPSMMGVTGKTYNLTVDVDGKTLTSSTKILPAIPLDTLWCKYEKTNVAGDSLGFIWGHLTDPVSESNAYRWLAMRQGKDFSFVPPPGAAFDDKFINGQSFDFAYNRGKVQNSTAPDDQNEESGYFKRGDTVVVKFCTIERAAYNFFRQVDELTYNQGNPFASPSSVPTNLYPSADALGLWCAYGVATHTVICK